MALWIRLARAIRLPHVFGSKPRSKFGNERTMIKTFVSEAQGAKVFARYANSTPHVDANIEVNIAATTASVQPHDSVAR